MLARPYRLPATVRLRSAKSVYTPSFVLKYAASEGSLVRCRVIVSKKVDKRATMRNSLRRSVSEIIQQSLSQFKQPLDLLFIINHSAARRDKEILQQEVMHALQKEGLV